MAVFSTHNVTDYHIFIVYSLKQQNIKSESLAVCDLYHCCSMQCEHLGPLKKLRYHPKKTEHMLPFPCSSPTDVNKRHQNIIQLKIVWILLLLYSKYEYNHGMCILTYSHPLSHPSTRKIWNSCFGFTAPTSDNCWSSYSPTGNSNCSTDSGLMGTDSLAPLNIALEEKIAKLIYRVLLPSSAILEGYNSPT